MTGRPGLGCRPLLTASRHPGGQRGRMPTLRTLGVGDRVEVRGYPVLAPEQIGSPSRPCMPMPFGD